jgi:hypothetical protein
MMDEVCGALGSAKTLLPVRGEVDDIDALHSKTFCCNFPASSRVVLGVNVGTHPQLLQCLLRMVRFHLDITLRSCSSSANVAHYTET